MTMLAAPLQVLATGLAAAAPVAAGSPGSPGPPAEAVSHWAMMLLVVVALLGLLLVAVVILTRSARRHGDVTIKHGGSTRRERIDPWREAARRIR